MKVLHVIPTYAASWRHGGPGPAVQQLCRALAARGHEITVFTTNVNGSETLPTLTCRPLDVEGIEVLYFPVTWPRPMYHSPSMRHELIRRLHHFDVLHLHSAFVWPTTAAARLAVKFGVPYCLAPRGMLIKDLVHARGRVRKLFWIYGFGRAALENAAAVHVTSELEALELRRFSLRLPAVEVIPNGVDATLANPPNWADVTPRIRELAAGPPFLLFLGRLSWKKGLDLLLDGLAHAGVMEVLLAGPDDENLWPRLARRAAARGLNSQFRYIGPVAGEDRIALLHSAAGLVLPSISENFGNVVLEAMTAGRPVIVTQGVGLAKLVAESGAGFVVPPEPARLGAAIRKLADPLLRQSLGRAAASAARRFEWREIAVDTEDLYRRMTGSRP